MAIGDILVGRNARVEVGLTEGAPITITAVTLANPGVASASAHGLAAKSVGYFATANGMVNLAGQAARLGATAAGTFALEDIDTTTYAAFTSGTFVPVTAWSTLAKSTSISKGGGEGEKLNATTLLDGIRQEINGLLAAETFSINVLSETLDSQGMALVRAAARISRLLVVRITWNNGDVWVFRGEPSSPGADVQQGQIGTGSISFTVKGFQTQGPA